jgi:uncharacterized protein (TIGR04168 family)
MTALFSRPILIAIAGDIHDQWTPDDNQALVNLGVDLVLFVGDFGNEAVNIVRLIAELPLPKAAIFGNHDAWFTASDWGRKQCPYDRRSEDRVQQQFDLLGDAQVGYGKKDFPKLNLSVIGARPFSWGGNEWKNRSFLKQRYGVTNFQESTAKITSAVQAATSDRLIFLGHNGPKGLGDRPEDICGRDWQPLGGDHGDPDFAAAIASARSVGKVIPLVTFGHMHHRLRHTQARLRTTHQWDEFKTLYLNAASVPRHQTIAGQICRNFSLVTLNDSDISTSQLVWINPDGQILASF